MSNNPHRRKRAFLDELVQYLIPPSLIVLLTVTLWDLFYGFGRFETFIDIFDLYVIIIFSIDLWYRYKEVQNLHEWVHRNYLDIIATIPYNFLFAGIAWMPLLQGVKGLRFLRFARLTRLLRFAGRLPRFLRLRGSIKKSSRIRKKQPHEKHFKGVLSFKVILLITINSIMGTGIYFLIAAGAKHAGPASLLSWAILSIISLYIAACFSELVSMFPKAGGVYEYAKQAYGRFWSFLIGWSTAIAGAVTIAMLILGALQYIAPQHPQLYIFAASLFILLFSAVAYRGMKTSVVVLILFALITLLSVLSLIIPGLFSLRLENFTPFFVFPSFTILLTIFFIAETFFGWESAVFLAAETKNPRKVMPRALIIGTLVIAVLSLSLAVVGMGLIEWSVFGQSNAPLSDIAHVLFGDVGKVIFTLLVFISILGAVASWIVTAPRLLMALAEDKLFFVQFAKIHPVYKSPYVSIIFEFFILILLVIIGSGSYETLLHMLIPLIIFIYSSVLLAVLVLRFKRPDIPRTFRVPFGKIGPLLTILFMFGLLVGFVLYTHSAWEILKISLSLILFGIPAYFFIELFYTKKYTILRRRAMFKLQHALHKTIKPLRLYAQMVSMVGGVKGTVIDFNTPHAGMTRFLKRKKMNVSKIIVLNLVKEEVEELRKEGFEGVEIHKIRSYTLPSVRADAFFSVNDLGQVKDVEHFVKQVSRVLKKRGVFCFAVRNSLVNVHPNAILLGDKKAILRIFKENSLDAKYLRKKKGLGEVLFIYGVKR